MMEYGSSNNDSVVIDLQLAKRQRGQTDEGKHREAVLGPCPGLEEGGLDVEEKGRVCAEILPNGQARLSDYCADVFIEEWGQIFIPYNRLVHAVCNSPALRDLPNGAWVRVSIEICDRWREHPSHPEYDEQTEYGWGMHPSFCDPLEELLTERQALAESEVTE